MRGKGEGSPFRDKHGQWWAQLSADDHGKRPKRRAKSQRDALEKLREMQEARNKGLNLSTKTPTVNEFMAIWLDQIVKRSVKPTTYHNYSQYTRLYVVPYIGTIRVKDLTTPQIQEMVNTLTDRLSASTARSAHQCLRAALDIAIEWKYRADNPANAVKLPRLPRSQITALEIVEARRILAAVEGHRHAALYHMLLTLGLRKGEVLGLRWRDLNWEKAEIKIAQQIQTVDGKTGTETPKTTAGYRTIPIPPALLARLRAHWQDQQEERRMRGTDWREHGLIFPSEVGTPKAPRNLNRHFYGVLRAAKLSGVRLHDLRHTCGTMMGDLGVPEMVIAAILGHSSGTITWRYVHPTMGAMREAVNAVELRLLDTNEHPSEAAI